MTCLECSNPVTEGASLCTFCGAPVEPKPSTESTEAEMVKAFNSGFLGKLIPKGEGVKEGEKLCLWNPWFIVLWLIPFLGVWVGSALIAINWSAMGKKRWAAWTWVYLLLDFIVGLFLLPDDLHILVAIIGGFVVWFLVVALPQVWFVHTYYPASYDRRRWLVPIGLGIIIGLSLPKVLASLGEWVDSMEATTPSQLAAVAQAKHPAKELTVEEVVQQRSGFVMPVEVSWKEPYFYFFSEEKKVVGSAVFMFTSGRSIFMVTNQHVVEVSENAQNVSRVVVDGKNKVPFEVMSKDSGRIDLALIKVMTAEPLQDITIPLARLDQIEVGQECVAIGNTLGFGISVTTGIVSKIDDMGGFRAIRTSAPISPGNSGGALFRRKDGALIGITSRTFDKDGAQAVNFAMPIDFIDKLEPIK